MKLGITSNIYLPFSCGVSNVIKETVNFLINKHNYDITIFTPNWLNSSSKEDQRNLHICRFPYKHIIQNYAISPKLFNSLKKQKFDIIHSHGFGYFPAFAGFLASKLNNTPHLLTPHYHPPIYGLFRKSLFWLYNLTQGLPMLRFSEKILPITEYEKKLLCNIGGTPKNMQISPNMINTNLIKFSNKILPIKTKEKIILRIGKFSREKGGDIAFNIAKTLKVPLSIVVTKKIGHPFDAVIVDLTIPGGIGGAKAVKKMAQFDPEVKAIASSGYSDDPIMADFRKYGFSGVLAKPYRIKELSEVLHKVVNGTSKS